MKTNEHRATERRKELDIARLCRTMAEASPIPTASVEGAGTVLSATSTLHFAACNPRKNWSESPSPKLCRQQMNARCLTGFSDRPS